MTKRIGIIGGGITGLGTAYFLEQESSVDLAIDVFEATERVGGMIQTSHFSTVPVPFEAGAAELYDIPHTPRLTDLIGKLGLATVSLEGSPTVVIDNVILKTEADLYEHLGRDGFKALHDFVALGKSLRSPEQFARAGWPADNDHPWARRSFQEVLGDVPSAAARRYLNVQVHSDLATEPALCNGLFGFDNLLIDEPEYCNLIAIKGGNEQLPTALRQGIQATVYMDSRVRAVRRDGDGYVISYKNMGKYEEREYDAVICALPHRRINSVSWLGEELKAAMAAHHKHYDFPTHYLRVTVLFESPFWREVFDESYFVIDAFDGTCVYDESSRFDARGYGILSFLIAGRAAFKWHIWCKSILRKAVLKALPEAVAHGRSQALEVRVNPWIRSVSRQPGGLPLKGLWERHLPEPDRHPGFFAAGDYHFDSTINGALDSGFIAARMALCHLGMADPRDEGLDDTVLWGSAVGEAKDNAKEAP